MVKARAKVRSIHLLHLFKMIIIVIVTSMLNSCYYDHAQQIYPSTGCDITNVTYSATITEIMTRNGCLSCHSGTLPSGGFVLNSYAAVKSKVSDGRLWGSINQLPGYVAMPQSGSKMNQCDINKIKAWIDSNTPQ